MDKKVPVSQCDVVTPPPPTKATLSSFPLRKTHYTSSSSCSSTSRRFRVRAYNNTSKFGNFLNLKPAHQPKPLDFDLPRCHPSDRSRFDVIIIGSGPVGTRLAEQVFRYEIKVCCVDPDPLSMWPNNYGVWVDEFESIDLEDCLEGVSPMGLNFTRESSNLIFLEETFLVSRPVLSYMEVKKRMVARLRHLGIRVKKILEDKKQTCIHTTTYAKKV
ncbi:neoxanthin synthase, chloroplastic-like [Arachis stenosperma]|uniref:neoxanthin synthase, chloroplastic-like n=1 Tax=Arachis stenosperma TaxID=217475 RepID=UPI0025ABE695|nr:neoxanthin synthase, chloroplastic-like [Arachis stenosperma]